ncbi:MULTISPECIES: Na/Pi cotransporter family protein [unclassified Synechococcus]|nr:MULTISPECIES: Na/Pi symporter [unclassified Synechococcus]
MSVLTENLRNLAGAQLRTALLRFTRTPLSGAVTGAVATALLQSSSATTVTTVGFVGAGLIRFPDSLGIIFGANLGSTALGWLVALLGIRWSLGRALLPLILVGALLRIFGRGRWAVIGFALAGFGLLFLGLDGIKAAMAGQGLLLDPTRFDGSHWLGRLQLVALGLVTTVITQSSAAGVASTLMALAAGGLDLGQAGALVVGMDVGSSVSAVVAALGSSISARRTGMAHLCFNLLSALVGLILLNPVVWFWQEIWPQRLAAEPEFALTSFHSGFNLLGVALALPFTGAFAHLIRALVPSGPRSWADALDQAPPDDAHLAIDQARRAVEQELRELLELLRRSLGGAGPPAAAQPPPRLPHQLANLQADLDRTETYLDQIHLDHLERHSGQRLIHLLHGLDHLQRLHERCEEEPDRLATLIGSSQLAEERQQFAALLDAVVLRAVQHDWAGISSASGALVRTLASQEHHCRHQVMQEVALGHLDVEEGTRELEAMRWLERVCLHIERIGHHLDHAGPVPQDTGRAMT